MLNIELIGNICQDAIVKTIENKTVTEFSVAVNKKIKGEDITLYIQCSRWGDSTKLLDYLKNGTKIFARGAFSITGYAKQDGTIATTLTCSVSTIELISTKKNEDFPE